MSDADDKSQEVEAPADPSRPEFVVGIGASAGGLESLQRFFDHLGDQQGAAFVVVQHLSPDFVSLMDELLARHTELPVIKVTDRLEVERDHVYLIPPGKDMTIRDGHLWLTDRDPRDKLSLPIDSFLRSLAADAGTTAVAVILSGTGSDGSRGAVSVADRGGLVLAESEATAKFHGMPLAAIDTGCVDRVLDADQMGEALTRYFELPRVASKALEPDGAATNELEALLGLLRDQSGIDFTAYKPATVARRVNRRLLLHHHTDLAKYVEQVREDPAELEALYRDLLIGVTRFFRDPDAYKRVRGLLEKAVETLDKHDHLRIWSAGCASGEEIYSLVMLANEAFRERDIVPRIKAFATDVHEGALRAASIGRFPIQAMESIPEEFRDRYFEANGDFCQANADLRSQIVFARHDMLRDAPFTRIDLITCRNLLIYFDRDAQRKALTLCHFGLKPNGTLFLGPSEAPTGLEDEFDVIDSRWKLFRKRRDVRLLPTPDFVPFTPARPGALRTDRDVDVASQARRALMDRFGPPALLVSHESRLIHAFGGAAEFLHHRDGEVSLDVLELLGDDLRFAVSATLQR
ncbi:MAG: chemotaxis protein CheB, partial [Pseudomonadota bacterium]